MIVLQFFPNGEFSQGVDTSRKRQPKTPPRGFKPSQLSQECRDAYMHKVQSGVIDAEMHLCVPGACLQAPDETIYEFIEEVPEGYKYKCTTPDWVESEIVIDQPVGRLVASWDFVPLGSSIARVLEKTQNPVKPPQKTMTKYMARNIRNAVYVLENKYKRDELTFLTLTIPPLPDENLSLLCSNWDYACSLFFKFLSYHLRKAGIENDYTYCTEIQPRRAARTNRTQPHLHIVFRGRKHSKAAWLFTPKAIRDAWVRCIKRCSGCDEFYTGALENVQRVKYSAARYLSKYLSKGNNTHTGNSVSDDVFTLRTHWGGISRALRRNVAQQTVRLASRPLAGVSACDFLNNIPKLIEAGYIKYFSTRGILLQGIEGTPEAKYLFVGSGALSVTVLHGGLIMCIDAIVRWSQI